MGVQATMDIGDKNSGVAATIASGAATFPAAGKVRNAVILAAGDLHRVGEVQRSLNHCYDHAKHANLFTSAVSIAVVCPVGGALSSVRTETNPALVVTGEVAVMIVGAVRAQGDLNITFNAHEQLVDWMNENDRLVS